MAQQQPQQKVPVPTKKIYTPLMEIPRILIGRCAQVLPNRMQCWRAGDFQVLEATSKTETTIYQLCRTHVTLQKLEDRLLNEKLAAGESIQEPQSTELPAPPLGLDALNAAMSFGEDPKNVTPPPIVLMGKQEGQIQIEYGTQQVLAESLTQTAPPASKNPSKE